MKVHIPTPLRSYTRQCATVDACGATLSEVLRSLDHSYPGIRFRIIDEQDGVRPHIKLFVNGERSPSLRAPVGESDVVHIICALSGG